MGIAFMINPASLTNAFSKIAETTLGGAAATVTFSSIATGYKWFFLFCDYTNSGGNVPAAINLNNDAGANYKFQTLIASGASITGGNNTGQTHLFNTSASGDGHIINAWISNLVGSPKKAIVSVTGNSDWEQGACEWSTTTEINRIDVSALSNNFAAGSRFILYGGA